jgi:V8-like Glu-specific endopeptidase
MTRLQWLGVALLTSVSQGYGQNIVSSPIQSADEVNAYWTAARRGAARPMPLRTRSGAPVAAPASVVNAPRTPAHVSGNLPEGASANLSVSLDAPAQQPTIGPGSTIWYSYPPPFTLSVPILDYIVAPQFPNTALGKLFFSDGTFNYVCSAQSVTSTGTWGAGNRQTVVTAGHCCSNGAGTFFRNWRFEPSHFNGATPFGAWTAGAATVFNAWHLNGDFSRDTCVLQMNKRNGQNINDAVGALGYSFNLTLPQHYTATGWPAAAPFTGGILYYSFASDAETDTQQTGSLPFTHGIGSSMTGGSSGGAWITKYQSFIAGGNNYFNGLNSYKYVSPNRPDEMFGPYIDNIFVTNLLGAVATAPPLP